MPGLPHQMGMLRLQIRQGYVVDLTDPDVVDAWGFDAAALSAPDPDAAQQAHCRDVGRAVRPVADVLRAPSARGAGENVPVYADREGSDLDWALIEALVRDTPAHVRQRSTEAW